MKSTKIDVSEAFIGDVNGDNHVENNFAATALSSYFSCHTLPKILMHP
jgi:hypothetical protein